MLRARYWPSGFKKRAHTISRKQQSFGQAENNWEFLQFYEKDDLNRNQLGRYLFSFCFLFFRKWPKTFGFSIFTATKKWSSCFPKQKLDGILKKICWFFFKKTFLDLIGFQWNCFFVFDNIKRISKIWRDAQILHFFLFKEELRLTEWRVTTWMKSPCVVY